jgi:aconitate hydratase
VSPPTSLGLTGEETFTITGVEALNEGTTPKTVKVHAEGAEGPIEFDAVVRIDTPGEADYYRNGGILQYVSGPARCDLPPIAVRVRGIP